MSNTVNRNNPHANKPASARERLQYEREAQARKQVRNRRIGIGSAVVAVVAIGAVVAVTVAGNSGGSGGSGSAGANQPLVTPAHASGPNGTVIVYGNPNAKHTLDVWEDFRCPVCDKLEKADGPTIKQLADNGTYKIQYHLATFLDNNLGGTGSMDALEVAGAALNDGGPTAFKAFHDVLYANQPSEETDGFGNLNTLLDLAKKVPGLVTPQFTKDVENRVYAPWAQKVSDAFNSSGIQGTPTLKLDGQVLNVFDSSGNAVTPAQYTSLVQQAVGANK
ncbi:thioredoxin domain-containing protein [Streptacidiphilus fuscans]|uniref:Thioredoxin domain-containing protein n=1 Tax=Streptacidiphilus fuscans TaxID=2789292 RepID=A0A931BEN6_9ACTN|nr:thioredoxin domain-containing protein [Streptacidiphilus fuscans]MBF9072060.1 thioredoxin domain-containing protein [Streptacidiphilus fuscans]